ncbi:MAG: hypothetical protein U1D26_02665 [Patescibacteria group bacterium]|nr:hypothetical protein [bacterium]MDZ4227360.1 hypothetical protein [Patescibacteria group bacterium]
MMFRYGVAAAALMFVVSGAGIAHAQFTSARTAPFLVISMTPIHPGPREAVHLTVHSPLLDISKNNIAWSAGGKVIAQGVGMDSADITAGALGSRTDVVVQATALDGSVLSATVRVVPTKIDLLFDSDSYVPPFYRGRALPSTGTSIFLEARPHFLRPDGSSLTDADITYTWRRNGQVLASVSGRGKSRVAIPSPVLYSTDRISVEAISDDESFSGEASEVIAAADPFVYLYEDSPLYGILYNNALGASAQINESEITLSAVPYFASVESPADPFFRYAWRVNGTSVNADNIAPNELTLSGDPQNYEARIELALTHARNLFLDAHGEWNVTLSASFLGDVFRSPFQQ